jgi:hypothetical protein
MMHPMLEPIPYASPFPGDLSPQDRSHLTTLAVCHYVLGGLQAFVGLFFAIYIVLGIAFLSGGFGTPPGNPREIHLIGTIFIVMGCVGLLLGVGVGVLTILAGRCLQTQRKRTFCMVMAGINCMFVPLGTVLGVFTFVVLGRPAVQQAFAIKEATGA